MRRCAWVVFALAGYVGPGSNLNFSNSINDPHGNGMVGWEFTLLQPITVSQVGWYDDSGSGLSQSFPGWTLGWFGFWVDSSGNRNTGRYTSDVEWALPCD